MLRGFRAEATATAPKIDASLQFKGGKVIGTVTNSSSANLENVAVVFAGAVAIKPALAGPAKRGTFRSTATRPTPSRARCPSQVFGSSFPRDPAEQRQLATRRAVLDQLTGYSSTIVGTPSDVPLLLGWQPGAALPVELAGDKPNQVGDSLFLVPLSMTYDAQTAFSDRLLTKTIIETKSDQAWFDGSSYNLSRGTMTVEMRPSGLSGTFKATGLQLALTQGNLVNLNGSGRHIEPLSDAQQPDQADPVGQATTGQDGGGNGVPVAGAGGGGTDPSVGETTAPDSTEAPATPAPCRCPSPANPELAGSTESRAAAVRLQRRPLVRVPPLRRQQRLRH